MTDYWKSTPRHFCKFCQCWIADNKPSRDFHEKGKRHQENVQKKIMDVRKKSFKDAQKKEEENSYMKEMEENAKKAFLQDLKSDPKLAQQYMEKARKKKEFVESKKKQESAESKKKQESAGQESTPAEQQIGASKTTERAGTWRITYSPEGYPYYWNDITGAVSWTEPEDGNIEHDTGQSTDQGQSDDKTESPVQEQNTESSQSDSEPENTIISTNEEQKSDEESSEDEMVEEAKESSIEQEDGDEKAVNSQNGGSDKMNKTSQQSLLVIDPHDISAIPLPGDIPLPPPPQSHTQPPPLPPPQKLQPLPPVPREEPSPPGLGPTQTPPRHEQVPPSVSGHAAAVEPEDQSMERRPKRGHDSAYGGWEQVVYEEPEQVDLQLPETEQHVEQKVIQLTEPKVKFREKKVNSLGADLVAFKKRKMNSRNLKQRGDS